MAKTLDFCHKNTVFEKIAEKETLKQVQGDVVQHDVVQGDSGRQGAAMPQAGRLPGIGSAKPIRPDAAHCRSRTTDKCLSIKIQFRYLKKIYFA